MMLGCLVFYPMLGALLIWGIGLKNKKLRDYLADLLVISELLLMICLLVRYGKTAGSREVLSLTIPGVCGLGLSFTLDGFRLIYGTVAAFMWAMTTILSREYFTHHQDTNRFYLFLLLTLGATMGVFFSADLFTTFVFFEMMSFTSYVWVAQEENRPSLRAAATYLAVAVTGGMVMLMGLFLLYHYLGTLNMAELLKAVKAFENKGILYAAGGCLLFGFGAKAGAFPLHIWLPKAHPVAPAPASALLSGILTKTGIFGILVISSQLFLHDAVWGGVILGIGVLTMVGGALLAVFSIDLKRTLACSSMSQIGFILVGVGMQGLLGEENALAVHGSLLHMVNHSLIKLVLFMAAGVIFMNTHALDLNEIRGFGRKKPLLKGIFLIGACAIGGIPLFGGYVSKTLIHESIVEYGGGLWMQAAEWLFLFSGGLTVAYMLKLFRAVFVESNGDSRVQKKFDGMKQYMNKESLLALLGSALVLLIWGMFPKGIMDRAANLGQGFLNLSEAGEQVSYFSWTNLSGALISIVIGVLVYFLFIRKCLMKKGSYVDCWPKWLDMENVIYRPILLRFLPLVFGVICRILDSGVELLVVVLRKTFYHDSPLPYELPEGNALTKAAGRFLNGLQSIANATWRHNSPVQRDYVHLLAVKREEWMESNKIIQRSLSFGLLLFCIGLCLTLIYIILW